MTLASVDTAPSRPAACAATLAATASYMRITSGITLKTITGGVAGDLLVLTSSFALTVDETGNIRLPGTTVLLNSPQDTLTLLYDGALWLAMAASDNA